MVADLLGLLVSRRPLAVTVFWGLLALLVGLAAPDLTRLAAEGQSKVLGRNAESLLAADMLAESWPEQSSRTLAILALHRAGGLTAGDRAYAARLAKYYAGPARPSEVLRVLGPNSEPEIARRMESRDRTMSLIAFPLASSFVAPVTLETVGQLQRIPSLGSLRAPAGLEHHWTGEAVIGCDYMAGVQTSLNRAAAATVVLLLGVLLVVYRSFWLALVPLATIGVSLLISRGVLAWMVRGGWEISPLVELFLVAVLFGSGTDFCLFVSWRFAEQFDAVNPAEAMRKTLRRAFIPLLTSVGTVIVGLGLMGTTRFKLFSSTGPSVAIGLALTFVATITLTPALLVVLAKYRPKSFRGMTGESSGLWERVGKLAMARPLLSWCLALLVMAPAALVGLRTNMVQDLMSELPVSTPSTQSFRLIASKFEPGMIAPLSLVLESDEDLRSSEGLALIDDLSRYLSRQKRLTEVRSATQPLGDPATLEPARLASRLGQVNDGFEQMSEGAAKLRKGLSEGAMKLRAAVWLEEKTGLSVTGTGKKAVSEAAKATGADPRRQLVAELLKASEGMGRLADGAGRARHEVSAILADPVGRRALDRLMVNAETVKAHPELNRSFEVYISADGHRARLELAQSDRVFSKGAMDGVDAIRRGVKQFLDEAEGPRARVLISGSNAESADVRTMTRADQFQSWFVIPAGVFLVLLIALRDPFVCFNLVATMLLTYAFALGATHLVFVTGLGAEGLDWKVPYFLFVLLVAVGVDYNIFLTDRLMEETRARGLKQGIIRAVGQTGGLITSAAAITVCSFASFMTSPLGSLRQLGFALVIGITMDALLVRPVLVPCGHWLMSKRREERRLRIAAVHGPVKLPALPHYTVTVEG